jgi:hypothetical protein
LREIKNFGNKMPITKQEIQELQSEVDNEKEQLSCQLYVSISNFLKKVHDQNCDKLHAQVSNLFDSHISKQTFESVPDLLEYLSAYREVLDLLRPHYESQERQNYAAQINFILGAS